MIVLCGDLGGTKTLLQLAQFIDGNYTVIYQKRYPSNEFDNLLPMLITFISDAKIERKQATDNIQSACFAIAGPISGNTAKVTNLHWDIDALEIQTVLNISRVKLINDFFAIASAIDLLEEKDILTLQQGEPHHNAPRAIIGAGTGLGVAMQVWTGKQYHVIPSEGGHVSFAPSNEVQIKLLEHLMSGNHHVAYENILSGPGLVKIFKFLAGQKKLNASLQEAMQANDPAAVISDFALAGKDRLAEQALDTFVQIYGRQAGNLALTCLAYGGVYIAGGIAAKIVPKLLDGQFLAAFNHNQKMGYLLQKMSVKLIVNPDVGLIGAAYVGSKL